MYKYILENGLKANIWLDESLIETNSILEELLVEKDVTINLHSRKIIVELFIPRAHNNYALLGIDFISDDEKKVKVKLSCNKHANSKYSDNLALSIDTVNWGILDEYKQGIISSVNNFLKKENLPSGVINYNISAHGEIGSSPWMFETVSNIVLSILVTECIDENEILNILKRCLNIR